MLVVDANDVSGLAHRDDTCTSPVLHPAIHNLIVGLRNRKELEVTVMYGRMKVAPGEDRWDENIHYLPIPYKPWPIPGIGGSYLARTYAILKALKTLKPDLIHAQGTERESGMVAALSKRPSILTLHGNFREIAKTMGAKPFDYLWLNALLENFAARRVNAILCISNYTESLVADLNSRLWTIPNAVHPSLFQVRNSPIEGRVVCLAGIGPRKNQLAFVRACDALAEKSTSFHIEFWGPGNPSFPYDMEFHAAVGSRSWASYKGTATFDQIPEILTTADALVLPSIEDNCPVAILEALAAGVPVVASGVGGIPDLVSHGSTGFLAGAGELDLQVQALEEILSNRDLRGHMSTNARSDALARFTPDAIAEAHLQIYQELLGEL